MKKYLNYLTAALFLSLAILSSCGGDGDGDGDGGDDGLAEIATNLVTPTFQVTSVTASDNQTDLDWTNEDEPFQITFTGDEDGGTYTTTNSKDLNVWPASGDWTFTDADGGSITRGDGTIVEVTVTTTSLTLAFDYATPTAVRTMVVDGRWTFNFSTGQ